MDIAKLIEIIREDFIDDAVANGQRWTDEFFLRSFSEAQRQACNCTDFLFTDKLKLTLKSGTATYILPNNLTKLNNLVLDGMNIEKKLEEQLPADWRTRVGFIESRERCFIVRGNRITFYPAPGYIDTGAKITIEGYISPADFDSVSDEPVIPEEFHKFLIYWVLYECYSNDDYLNANDEAKSLVSKQQFHRVFGQSVAANVRKHQFETSMR